MLIHHRNILLNQILSIEYFDNNTIEFKFDEIKVQMKK